MPPYIVPVMILVATGISLMIASFTLVIINGSWRRAMGKDEPQRWTVARILMVTGASIHALLVLLSLILNFLTQI